MGSVAFGTRNVMLCARFLTHDYKYDSRCAGGCANFFNGFLLVLRGTVVTIGFFESNGCTMTLSSEKIGEVLVVSPAGQINSANAADVESGLLAWVEQGERLCVLDLGQLDYISSAGLRVVLMLAKRLKQNEGQLVLCGLQPQVHEVFDISGFLSILTVVDSRPAALSRLAA